MSNSLNLNAELHKFPLPPEAEGVNFVDLSKQARAQFVGEALLDRLSFARSETLSYKPNDNEVVVLDASGLPGGSFKFLSASVSLEQAADEGYSEVVSPSAGSFGTALGYAAQKRAEVKPVVCLPANASQVKRQEMQELGVRVINWGQNFDETPFAAHLYARRQGARFVHPYASMADVAATGILGLEIAEQYPEVSDVVTQAGGGSLHSGVSSVVGELLPATRFTLGQTAGCSPYVDTLLSGKVQTATDVHRSGRSYFSNLGGVGVGRVHPFTLGIGSQYADAAHRVYPDHVYATMHDYREEHGVLPEFAAAVGLETARELARTSGVRGARIIAILTGNRAEEYPSSYLKGLSSRRREEEHYQGRGSSVHAFS